MRPTDKRVVKYFGEAYEVLYGHCYIATDSNGDIFAHGERPHYEQSWAIHDGPRAVGSGCWVVRDGAGHGTPSQYIGMMSMLDDSFNPELSLRKI